MRWDEGSESSNVEDRRGQGGGGGGFGGLPIGRGGIGIGTLLIALVVGWIFGINPLTILGMFGGGGGPAPQEQVQPQRQGAQQPANDDNARFASKVLKSTEDVWQKVFQQSGYKYQEPSLVLYTGGTRTACGMGSAAAGPFYCPGDGKLYLDTSFFRVMEQRLGAKGDAARAYVIAHEVGHHIQNLEGTMQKMEQARQQRSERDYNQLSVLLELQADCYAGIWANHSQEARQWFDKADIEDALRAAAAVGDDHIQQQTQGTVRPESFTHGSSEQRLNWLRRGMEAGSLKECDTFAQQR